MANMETGALPASGFATDRCIPKSTTGSAWL